MNVENGECAGMGLAVVGLLFEYLAMLRKEGPQQYIYQELADIGAMKVPVSHRSPAFLAVVELGWSESSLPAWYGMVDKPA